MGFPKQLEKKYEVQRKLGQGGMGQVYLAVQRSNGETVAIKVLCGKLANDESHQKRFLREAELAAQQQHPSIVRALDYGCVEGQFFIVYEYVLGKTLDQLLKECRPLPTEQVEDYLQQLAEILDSLHKAGVVHRDIKPSNVMVDDRGRIRLLDFGVARFCDTGQSITETGVVVGTPYFLSPELIKGIKATPAADVYAAGALGILCLAKVSPFSSWHGRVIKKLNERAAGLERLPIPLAAGGQLGEILRKATAYETSQRFLNGSELLQALKATGLSRAEEFTQELTKSGVSSALPATEEMVSVAPTPPKQATQKARRAWFPFALILLLFILFLLWPKNDYEQVKSGAMLNLKISTGADFVEARWSSKYPYKGTIKLESAVMTAVSSAESKMTTSHKVRIYDVEPDSKGELQVFYPWGQSSLKHKFKTLAPKLRLFSVTEAKKQIRLQFHTTPSSENIKVQVAGKVVSAEKIGHSFRAIFPAEITPNDFAKAEIRVTNKAGRVYKFSIQQAVRQDVLKAGAKLDLASATATYNDVLLASKRTGDTLHGPQQRRSKVYEWRRQKSKAWRRQALTKYRDSGDFARLNLIYHLAPLAFGFALSTDEQAEIVNKFKPYRQLKTLLFKFDRKPIYREPFFGQFAFAGTALGSEFTSLKLTREPLRLTEGFHTRGTYTPLWRKSFELPERPLKAAELRFSYSRWRGPYLAFKLNGKTLFIPSPRLLLKTLRRDVVYQRLPVSYLLTGRNKAELRIESVERQSTSVTIEVLELLLYY